MNETLSILVMVGGGLGTFLLGMKHLSEGLKVRMFESSARGASTVRVLTDSPGMAVS